ncbi:MAG: energy transducer TonB [Sphingobacteriales bacterium]|nr:energy transducer TonB [Sphingobacteriales bacterium]
MKKIITLITIMLFCAVAAQSQTPQSTLKVAGGRPLDGSKSTEQSDSVKHQNDTKKTTYDVVELMPQFPGGDAELLKYLRSNIQYPEEAKRLKIEGKVFVSFVVEKDGNIANAKVLRGIGGGCNEEALRVIQNMPKWVPGLQGGEPVSVSFKLPIVFKKD